MPGKREESEELRRRFSEGLAAFRVGDLKAAVELFGAIERELGPDGPSAFYQQLCSHHLAAPPIREWTGIVHLAHK